MAWAALNHTELTFRYAGMSPDPKLPRKDEPSFDVKLFPQRPKHLSDAWQAYQSVHDDWKERGKFKQRFPQETGYRHSLAEETEALMAEIRVLERLKGDIETAELVLENQPLVLLLKLHQAGVLEAYVLFRLADEGIAKDYSAYRAGNRNKLEEYIDKFVVPPVVARRTETRTATSPKPCR